MIIPIKQGGSDSGQWLWFSQRLTGIAIILLVGIHWVLQHFSSYPAGGLAINYSEVVMRLSQPGWRVFYSIFLVTVLFHGFHGLWMIGRDYLHAKWSQITLAGFLVSAMLLFSVWGLTVIYATYAAN